MREFGEAEHFAREHFGYVILRFHILTDIVPEELISPCVTQPIGVVHLTLIVGLVVHVGLHTSPLDTLAVDHDRRGELVSVEIPAGLLLITDYLHHLRLGS